VAKKVIKEQIEEIKEVHVDINVDVDVENVVEELEPLTLKENEVYIHGKGLMVIKPTKLKYFKDNSYNNYMVFKTIGVHEVLKYGDGEDIIKSFLSAVFDVHPETIDYIDNMSIKNILDIVDIANKINDIKDSDFLKQATLLEVNPEV